MNSHSLRFKTAVDPPMRAQIEAHLLKVDDVVALQWSDDFERLEIVGGEPNRLLSFMPIEAELDQATTVGVENQTTADAAMAHHSPSFPRREPTTDTGVLLAIDGMRCGACVARVENVLRQARSVSSAHVNFADSTAWVEGSVDVVDLCRRVHQAGYGARVVDSSPAPEPVTPRFWRAALGISAGGVAMIWMGSTSAGVGIALAALTAVVMVVCGHRFYRGAWLAMRSFTFTMDTLIAIGTLSAFLYSLVALLGVTGAHAHLYFDSAAMILGFVNLGQGLELRARRRTTDAVRTLIATVPQHTFRIDPVSGDEQQVALADIVVGDRLRVAPGATIPVDGSVEEGSSEIDESMLTGEPMPRLRQRGDGVRSGTINGVGSLVVRATAVGEGTAMAQIVRQMRRAQNSKPELGRRADAIAAVFVPVVLVFALLTALIWSGNTDMSLQTSLAVLVIACPCALGLATPLSVMVAVGRAAKLGLLLRDGSALDQGATIDTLVFDKTGTLTMGLPQVVELEIGGAATNDVVKAQAAALAINSQHPAARAVLAYSGATDLWATATRERPGEGIEGKVGGVLLLLGSRTLLQRHGITPPVEAGRSHDSAVYLAVGDTCVGTFWISDVPRAESRGVISRARALGLRTVLLSGDRQGAVDRVAGACGLDLALGNLTPADKAEWIRQQQSQGRKIAMVGDGINDAPALAQANLGIAMGHGAAVAIESAAVTLLRPSLDLVLASLSLSRLTVRNIKENFFAAFGYNVLAIPLAAGLLYPLTHTLIDPSVAAIAMSLSSISVVLNALRLNYQKIEA